MKVLSVKVYKTPCYPQKEQVSQNQSLLLKLPERWKRNACVCTAMSSLALIMLTSCKLARTAGVTIFPNITLTEDEAIYVICEESKKQGLVFSKDNVETINIDLPSSATNENGIYKFEMSPSSLKLDGYNSNKKVGFEYISDDDSKIWFGAAYNNINDPMINQLSKNLTDKIHSSNNAVKANVFYSAHFSSKQSAEDNLREQVKDFLLWLKSQGII